MPSPDPKLALVDELCREFLRCWQKSAQPPELAGWIARAAGFDPPARSACVARMVEIDIEQRRMNPPSSDASGATLPPPPRAEDYLAELPELAADTDLTCALICQEFDVRMRQGDSPSVSEYLRRFPQLADRLKPVLEQRSQSAATRDVSHEPTFPQSLSTAAASGPVPAQIGRYQIQRVLGAGAFGTVYLAADSELHREVAIKVPHTARLSGSEGAAAFLREARTAARLHHPGIVTIHDVGRQPDGACYVVMEYVRGETLADLLRRGRLPLARAMEIAIEIAEAMQHAHQHGLVHRDLKPANVLIDQRGRVRVTDFGLAVDEASQRQRSGEVAGTPAYMAPEQVRGQTQQLDGRTDIWALGVILYEMLTGRPPYVGTPAEIFDQVLHRSVRPPRQLDEAITAELERVCLKCLATNLEGRFTATTDVARALRNCQALPTRRARLEFVFLPIGIVAVVIGVLAILAVQVNLVGAERLRWALESPNDLTPYFYGLSVGGFLPLGLGIVSIVFAKWWCCGRMEQEERVRNAALFTTQPPEKSRKAVSSLGLGLASLGWNLLAAVPAIVLGAWALWDIYRRCGWRRGTELAVLGITFALLGSLINSAGWVGLLDIRQRLDLGERARKLLEAEQYELAVLEAQRALDLNEEFASAWKWRGIAEFHLEQYDAAIESLSRAVGDGWDFNLFGSSQGNKTEIRAAAAYHFRGLARQKQGDGWAADDDLRRANELDPRFPYERPLDDGVAPPAPAPSAPPAA